MQRYNVEITETAETDIFQICDHISKDKRDAALEWVREIERQIGSLETFPLRCPVIPESNDLGREYRHLVYGNYRTIFRIEGCRVTIMRVIHSARLLNMEIFDK